MQQSLVGRLWRVTSLAVLYPVLLVLSLLFSAYFAVTSEGPSLVTLAMQDELQGRGAANGLVVDIWSGSAAVSGLTFDNPQGERLLTVGSVIVEAGSPFDLAAQQIQTLSVQDVELVLEVDDEGKVNWEKLKLVKPPRPPSPPEPFAIGRLDVKNVRIRVKTPMADLVLGPFSVVGSVSGDEQDKLTARTVLVVDRIAITVKEHPMTQPYLDMLPSRELEAGPIELKVDWSDPLLSLHKLSIQAGTFSLLSNGEVDLNALQGQLLLMLADGDTTLFKVASRREGDKLDLGLNVGPFTTPALPLPDLPLPPLPLGGYSVNVSDTQIVLAIDKQPLPSDLLAYIAPEGGFISAKLELTPDMLPLPLMMAVAAAGEKGRDVLMAHIKAATMTVEMQVPQFLPDGMTLLKGFALQKLALTVAEGKGSGELAWRADEVTSEDTVIRRPDMLVKFSDLPVAPKDLLGLFGQLTTPEGAKAVVEVVRKGQGTLRATAGAVTIGPRQVVEKLLVEGSVTPTDKGVEIDLKGAPAPLGSILFNAKLGPFGETVPYAATLQVPRMDLIPIIQAAQLPGMVGQMFGGVLAGTMEWTAADLRTPLLDVTTCDWSVKRPGETIGLKLPASPQKLDFGKEPDVSPLVLMSGGEIGFGEGKLLLSRTKEQAKDDGVPAE